MYGMSDAHWDSEYFIMKAVAEEQNKLLQEVLTEIKSPELMKKTALAIVDFSQRITTAST
jgi:hypothetical protein